MCTPPSVLPVHLPQYSVYTSLSTTCTPPSVLPVHLPQYYVYTSLTTTCTPPSLLPVHLPQYLHVIRYACSVSTDIFYLTNTQSIEHFKGNYDNFEKIYDELTKNKIREYEAQQQFREHAQVSIYTSTGKHIIY